MVADSEAALPAPSEHHTPHHRVRVVDLQGKEHGTITLPRAFSETVRPDLIRKAIDVAQSHRRQPYGASLTGGRRHSVQWSGKGHGVSRTPRLMDSMRGAQAPNTVGGGAAHPPRVDRIWTKRINTKERRLAFASALAATRIAPLARARGHQVPEAAHLPIVVTDPVEEIATSRDARELLEHLDLWPDVRRAQDGTRVRSGRGKRRNRMRRTPRSLLVVTSAPRRARGFRNLAGVEVVTAHRLGTEDLAPGGDPGRLTIFSHAAIETLRERLGEERP